MLFGYMWSVHIISLLFFSSLLLSEPGRDSKKITHAVVLEQQMPALRVWDTSHVRGRIALDESRGHLVCFFVAL